MLLPENFIFSICTLIFENVVGLSALVSPNVALQNGDKCSFSTKRRTLVFDIVLQIVTFPSADSFKKGCCQLQAKVCAGITG